MIFASQEAADRWMFEQSYYGHYTNTPVNLSLWNVSAVMCDGDVRKPIRMRKYAREALDALDKLDAECDAEYCRRENDLAMDINCAMADVSDILDRLEALE